MFAAIHSKKASIKVCKAEAPVLKATKDETRIETQK